jgi:hypothetical protein
VPHYFNSVSVGAVLKQLDSPEFAWRSSNLLRDELKVPKRNSIFKRKNTIDDYQSKSSMFGQNGWSKNSAKNLPLNEMIREEYALT